MIRLIISICIITILFCLVYICNELNKGETVQSLFGEAYNNTENFAKKIIQDSEYNNTFSDFENKDINNTYLIYMEYIASISKEPKEDKFYQYFKMNKSSKYKIGNKTICNEVQDFSPETVSVVFDFFEVRDSVLSFESLESINNGNLKAEKLNLINVCDTVGNKGLNVYEAVLFQHIKNITILTNEELNSGYLKARKSGLFLHRYFPTFIK